MMNNTTVASWRLCGTWGVDSFFAKPVIADPGAGARLALEAHNRRSRSLCVCKRTGRDVPCASGDGSPATPPCIGGLGAIVSARADSQ